jgi:hypothetical protein
MQAPSDVHSESEAASASLPPSRLVKALRVAEVQQQANQLGADEGNSGREAASNSAQGASREQHQLLLPSVRVARLLKSRSLPPLVNRIAVAELGVEEELSREVHPRVRQEPGSEDKQGPQGWQFDKSMFATLRHDDAYLSRCFFEDWTFSKVPKVLAKHGVEEINAVKLLLLNNFRLLQDVYSHFCALYSPDMFFMAPGAFSEFLSKSRYALPQLRASCQCTRAGCYQAKGPGKLAAPTALHWASQAEDRVQVPSHRELRRLRSLPQPSGAHLHRRRR